MANGLDLNEILEKVKATSFRDDESVISEKANGHQCEYSKFYYESEILAFVILPNWIYVHVKVPFLLFQVSNC